jgi:hypothetical protein
MTRFLQRALSCGRRVAQFLQAIVGLVLLVLTTLASSYEVLDVTGLAQTIFANSARASLIVGLVSIGFAVLKAILQNPKGFSAKYNLDDGE